MPFAFPKRSSAPVQRPSGSSSFSSMSLSSALPYGLSFLAAGSALNVLTENPLLLVGLAGAALLVLKR
jgi:hypothetical protein